MTMRTPSATSTTSTTSLSKAMESVKVVVRCRPLNAKEVEQGHECCVNMFPDRGLIELRNPNLGPTDPMKTFTFDAVYDRSSKQLDLYAETFAPLVDSVLDGFNGTIFAYGQTGSGKTYSILVRKKNYTDFTSLSNTRELNGQTHLLCLENYRRYRRFRPRHRRT